MAEMIFVVDADPQSCQVAKQSLEPVGYAVHTFSTSALFSEVKISRPSVILISAHLNERNGFAICQQLRASAQWARTPLVLMLENPEDQNRDLILKSGADDYIAKPFSGEELVAKISNVLSRFPSSSSVRAVADATDIVIDSWGMKVSVRGAEVAFTTLEFRLIEYLARHREQVFTRDLLLDAVWGQMQFVTPRSVDACIRRIRGKIELNRAKPILLRTVRGVGYRLEATVSWDSSVNEDCHCIACATRGTRTLGVNNMTRRPLSKVIGTRINTKSSSAGRTYGASLA